VTRSKADVFRSELQRQFQSISELVSYLGHADAAMRSDPAEWHRNLIRALADISEAAQKAETALTINAVKTKALNPTEVSRAARITRNAVYKRLAAEEK
jgi:inactivated superfamily I helicase